LIDDVLEVKPKALWLQLGIRNDAAVQPVIDAGIFTIQDTCIAVMHSLCKSQ
jgi:predicted CoA-binding protein